MVNLIFLEKLIVPNTSCSARTLLHILIGTPHSSRNLFENKESDFMEMTSSVESYTLTTESLEMHPTDFLVTSELFDFTHGKQWIFVCEQAKRMSPGY